MNRWVLVILVVATLGLAGLVVTAAMMTSLEQGSAEEADLAFAVARAPFQAEEPLLQKNENDEFVRRIPLEIEIDEGARAQTLRLLAYHVKKERITRAEGPLWFLKLKEFPLQFALGQFGVDLRDLNFSIGELQNSGPCLVLDESFPSGNQIILWTE